MEQPQQFALLWLFLYASQSLFFGKIACRYNPPSASLTAPCKGGTRRRRKPNAAYRLQDAVIAVKKRSHNNGIYDARRGILLHP